MENEQLETIFTVANPVKAEIIKNYLDAEGIPCFLEGINQAAEAGLNTLEIKIQVSPSQAAQAQELIRVHEEHRAEDALQEDEDTGAEETIQA